MTRETKLGIVVSGSFLALVGVVFGTKLREPPPEPEKPEPIAAVPAGTWTPDDRAPLAEREGAIDLGPPVKEDKPTRPVVDENTLAKGQPPPPLPPFGGGDDDPPPTVPPPLPPVEETPIEPPKVEPVESPPPPEVKEKVPAIPPVPEPEENPLPPAPPVVAPVPPPKIEEEEKKSTPPPPASVVPVGGEDIPPPPPPPIEPVPEVKKEPEVTPPPPPVVEEKPTPPPPIRIVEEPTVEVPPAPPVVEEKPAPTPKPPEPEKPREDPMVLIGVEIPPTPLPRERLDNGAQELSPPKPPETRVEPPKAEAPPRVIKPVAGSADPVRPIAKSDDREPLRPTSLPIRREPKVVVYSELRHVVNKGETYAAIAKKYYMTEAYGEALRLYNRFDAIVDGPKAPRGGALRADDHLMIPDLQVLEARYARHIPGYEPIPALKVDVRKEAEEEAQEPPTLPYRVPRAMTMREIAETVLGDGEQWRVIYQLNPGWRPEYRIPEGIELRVPPE